MSDKIYYVNYKAKKFNPAHSKNSWFYSGGELLEKLKE